MDLIRFFDLHVTGRDQVVLDQRTQFLKHEIDHETNTTMLFVSYYFHLQLRKRSGATFSFLFTASTSGFRNRIEKGRRRLLGRSN